MILLDTHAWIWWVSNPQVLSKQATQALKKAASQKSIFVSCMSAWEVGMLVKKQRLKLSLPVGDWIARSENLSFLTFVPINNEILLRSVAFPDKVNQDPADRIILATALTLGARLLTKDASLRKTKIVETIW